MPLIRMPLSTVEAHGWPATERSTINSAGRPFPRTLMRRVFDSNGTIRRLPLKPQACSRIHPQSPHCIGASPGVSVLQVRNLRMGPPRANRLFPCTFSPVVALIVQMGEPCWWIAAHVFEQPLHVVNEWLFKIDTLSRLSAGETS